ncbi:4Fe-4S binding protein [Methanococcus voltae]|uniref:4Fe-4S ferredoxin-type domain-containing protein n=1 Tax=Methanococcus voltae (strain ATCC BAA-1334 / A3) TaxID=456320 RepID=D7DTJ8_METV3|nr:4Fe-4S binding protein [Methanococcus voltae]MCS3901310.1 hypothetical protein [Methanococcus voltae]
MNSKDDKPETNSEKNKYTNKDIKSLKKKLLLKNMYTKLIKYGIFLVSIPSLAIIVFRCPYIVPFVVCDMCPVVDCPSRHLRKPVFALILGYLAITRVDFCGRVCPYGTLNDVLYKIRTKIFKGNFKTNKEYKIIFNVIKYLIFTFAVIALLMGDPRFYSPIRTGSLLNSIWITLISGNNAYYGRLYLILLGLVLSMIIARFWCRYMCPYGTGIQALKKLYRKVIKKENNKTKENKENKENNACSKCTSCKK